METVIWQAYGVALSGVVLAQIAPGPNLLAVAGAALGQGRRAGLSVAAGVACAIFAWVVIAASGLTLVLALYPDLLTAMKLAGGLYLVYLGARGLRAAMTGTAPHLKPTGGQASGARAFRRGFLVNITNPKSALMWAAVATVLFGAGLDGWQVVGFAPIGCGSALCVYGLYALIFSSAPVRGLYARLSRGFEALFGTAFALIGGALVVDGLRDLVRRV